MTNNRYRTATKPALALGMLFCLMIFMLVVTSLLTQLLSGIVGSTVASLRIMAVLQDVLVFILPAILTALLTTRYPGELLEVMHGPRIYTTLWAILALLVSIPMMNAVIEWNDGWNLPDSMRWARQLEEDARLTTQIMLGGTSVGSLIISILIVGVLTGIAEELFFRGGIQKLLMCTHINPHCAIWLAALIFSAMHLQLYGFVPRVLLGAFFGYTMWWSGTLWLPVILHALNNSLVVVTSWMAARGELSPEANIDQIAQGDGNLPIVILSLILTAIALYMLYRTTRQKMIVRTIL